MKKLIVIFALCLSTIFVSSDVIKRCWIVGDLDNSGSINITDLVFLSNFLYSGGPAPEKIGQADFDGNGLVNTTDLILLSRYLYQGCGTCLGDVDKICTFEGV